MLHRGGAWLGGLVRQGATQHRGRQVQHWQRHGHLLGRNVLELCVGSLLVGTAPQVGTVYEQLTLWGRVTNLK